MGRPALWFLLAGALAIGALVLVTGVGRSGGPPQRILVAARVIPAGTVLGADEAPGMLAMAEVPDGLGLAGLLPDVAEAEGRRTVSPLAAGEPVTQASLGGAPGLGPAPLAPGERAVPVPLRAAGSAAGAPLPGTRVDVLASDGEGLAGRTRVVVPGAEVLAIMREDASRADGAADALVLRVTAGQALEVTRALDFAREVRVVARPDGEP